MNTQFAALTLGLLAAAATPVVAGASHSSGQGPQDVTAAGTAIRTAVLPGANETRVMMGIAAHSRASGQDARGRFFVKRTTDTPVAGRPDLDFSGELTCLRVIGNRAIVGGMITNDRLDVPSNPIEGTGFLAVYVDNDQGGGGPNDESNSTPGVPPPGDSCPTSVSFATAPFQQGNYVIHDNAP